MSGRLVASAMLVGLLCAGFAVGTASAQEAASWGYDLSHELMSPFCPGRTLASCPSPQAAELVQWIVTQEASGASREQVVEMLIERYGEEILGAPPAEGITLWAYVFPVLGFTLGGAVAFVVLRRIVGGGAGDGDDVPPPPRATPRAGSTGPEVGDDELARLVDEDLADRS
ncbi:MAG: cytochrome c-type biogenesis protein CcmH [Deltaproteobacteria bacterium]|nr:cytochrome c-type biogenesis protein CcmH [Deltaproteobacteria bacterium]